MANPDPALGLILNTDASCKIKGQIWSDIPTLVWPDGIDEAASDWFRALVVEYRVAASSAREYAKVIRPFLRLCRERGRDWQTVDDEFLILWRENLRRAQKVSIGRVNASLKTIFAFYRWAEETKRTRFQVGIYGEDELPDALRHVAFPISAKRNFSKGKQGRVFGGWTTPLTLSEPSQGGHVRHTPSEEEIRDLHQIVAEREHGERDSLMLSWAEEAGPRRAEILRVGKSHMPTGKELAELIEKDEPWLVVVPRKGGKLTPLNVPPDLVIRTLDYIQFGRREIVDLCHKTVVGYREPDEIFLSGSTGLPLHPESLTALARRAFRRVGIERGGIHRLRARYAVRTVETLVESIFEGKTVGPESSWIETIIVKAAESMGHSNPQSLRPYLTYVLNRRLQTADAMKAEKLASRLRSLRLHEDTLVRRMERHQNLHRVAGYIKAGKKAEAANELRRMADELE